MLRKNWGRTLILLFLLSAISCKNENVLYLYNWTYYTPESVIQQFEKEFNVTVKIDNYASNEEMFAKLLAGAHGYDIIVPSQDYVSIMIKQDMLHEIDLEKIPNAKNIDPFVLKKANYDSSMRYSVPYYMGAAGILVNKNYVSSYEKSWNIFSRKDLKNRMSMMDDMREIMGDALVYNGYSVNSLDPIELKKAQETITKEWKPNLVKFDAEGYGKTFAAGDFWVVQGYAECVYGEVAEEEWDSIDFFIPQEGGPMYIDSLCIPKEAPHYELALKFINFIHRPEIYAQFLDEFRFPATVNKKAEAYTKKEPLYSKDAILNCEIKEDIKEGLKAYNDIWQEIRYTD